MFDVVRHYKNSHLTVMSAHNIIILHHSDLMGASIVQCNHKNNVVTTDIANQKMRLIDVNEIAHVDWRI